MEKFSEMKYVRPDGEAYIRTIQKETKNFNEAADFEGAHQAFVAILNANSHFNTTRVMASIRNSQDTNDEFYRKEMEYIFEIELQIDVEMKKFYESYLKSSYRTADPGEQAGSEVFPGCSGTGYRFSRRTAWILWSVKDDGGYRQKHP